MWKLIKGGSDTWSLPVTEWSLRWKRQFEHDQIEISLERDGTKHIADVVSTKGAVLKFQHRWLDAKAIQEREQHFGNMVWIFNSSSWDIDLIKSPRYYTDEHGYKRELPQGKWVGYLSRYMKIALSSCQMPVFLDFGGEQLYWYNWQRFERKLKAQFDPRQGVMKVYTKQEIVNRYKTNKATPPTSDQTTEEAASK